MDFVAVLAEANFCRNCGRSYQEDFKHAMQVLCLAYVTSQRLFMLTDFVVVEAFRGEALEELLRDV